MVSLTTKLYVQLQPDSLAVASLRQAQTALSGSGRLVNSESLHLTVIHIGLISRLLASLAPHTAMPVDQILARLSTLAVNLESTIVALNFEACQLQPIRAALYGLSAATYVIEFEPTAPLHALHRCALNLLKSFLVEAGILNAEAFMANDSNLTYALTLKPHITIANSYCGPLHSITPAVMNFTVMPVVYEVG